MARYELENDLLPNRTVLRNSAFIGRLCEIAMDSAFLTGRLGFEGSGVCVCVGIRDIPFQVFGRSTALFLVLIPEPRLHDKPFVFYLFAVWSLIEVVR